MFYSWKSTFQNSHLSRGTTFGLTNKSIKMKTWTYLRKQEIFNLKKCNTLYPYYHVYCFKVIHFSINFSLILLLPPFFIKKHLNRFKKGHKLSTLRWIRSEDLMESMETIVDNSASYNRNEPKEHKCSHRKKKKK